MCPKCTCINTNVHVRFNKESSPPIFFYLHLSASGGMGRMTIEARQRAVLLWKSGMKITNIHHRFKEENLRVSVTAIYHLIGKFAKTGNISDLRRNPRPSILETEHYEFIDQAMLENDELTAYGLLCKLKETYPHLKSSLSTVRRARRDLGWVSTTPKYCQLIREANKEKRLNWCLEVTREKDTFTDVIWTDECSVQLQCHSLRCYRKKGQVKRFKPRPKHPLKVHIWGGISYRGPTQIVIFTGKLCATKLLKIFDASLLPFVRSVYPEQHRLMQDNDPKHTSRLARTYFECNNVHWWKTPPESPDLNPIENVWGSMKRFLRDYHKPRNQASLLEGIKKFWKTLTPEVCRRYINHIHKVIPKVIEENGGPSGY